MTKYGPLPLEEARGILRASPAFVRGDSPEDGEAGHRATADRMWEALLSLEDAAELCEVASRLDWQFHPRGFDNVDLYERYGDGIVPWLATCVDSDGVLRNVPWCVVPCLLRCGSEEAFALAWRVTGVAGRTPWGGAGDRDLFTAWRDRHPDIAETALERLAPTDARARAHLAAMGLMADPPRIHASSPAEVLAHLDACFLGMLPTRVSLSIPPIAHGLRVVAARSGHSWGMVFEWIEGTRPTGLYARRVAWRAFGSEVRGPVHGAATGSRPVVDAGGSDPEGWLGPAESALAALALPVSAVVIAHTPLGALALPSDSRALERIAAALVTP